MNPQFFVSTDNRTVVCEVISKGQKFRGVAKCNTEDTPNFELGKRLAMCRADLLIRKRDLEEIREVKNRMEYLSYSHRLYMQYFQDACRVEKKQLEHMRNLKDQIKNLSNGIM